MASCYEGVGNVPLPFSFHDPPQYGMVLFVRKEVRRDRKDSTDALIECRGPLNIKNSPPYSGVSAVNHGNEDYSSFHNGGPLVSERSVRNPKILTAGFRVKSKNKTLKIPYLVRIRLMG